MARATMALGLLALLLARAGAASSPPACGTDAAADAAAALASAADAELVPSRFARVATGVAQLAPDGGANPDGVRLV